MGSCQKEVIAECVFFGLTEWKTVSKLAHSRLYVDTGRWLGRRAQPKKVWLYKSILFDTKNGTIQNQNIKLT